MGNLTSLRKNIQRKSAELAAPKKRTPKPALAPVPEVPAAAVKSIMAPLFEGVFQRMETLFNKVMDRPDPVIEVDEEVIRRAVAEEIKKIPEQKITFPAREPVTYRATVEYRGNRLTGALIKPVESES